MGSALGVFRSKQIPVASSSVYGSSSSDSLHLRPHMPAQEKALRLREIVSEVFRALKDAKDYRSLRSCAVVNRMWFEEATPVLWREVAWNDYVEKWEDKGNRRPQLKNLIFNSYISPDYVRLQWYAKQIETLELEADYCWRPKIPHLHREEIPSLETYYGILSRLQFSRLKHLYVDIYELNLESNAMAPFLQPTVKRISYWGSYFNDTTLEIIQRNFPNLEDIMFDNTYHSVTSEGFLNFLESTPSLTKFEFILGFEDVFTCEIMVHFAKRPKLESIGLPKVPDLWVQRALEGPGTNFANLRALDMTFSSAASFEKLSRNLPLMEVLDLKVHDSTRHFLCLLSRCPRLREAHLYIPSGQHDIFQDDLTQLAANCKALTALDITPPWATDKILGHDFSDEAMQSFFSALPSLTEFVLPAHNSSLTIKSVETLGRQCKKLRCCQIHGNISTAEVLGIKNLFWGNLESLLLGMTARPELNLSETSMPIQHAFDTMRRLMPKLGLFFVINGSTWDANFGKLWKTYMTDQTTLDDHS